jgi:hypothetical protein
VLEDKDSTGSDSIDINSDDPDSDSIQQTYNTEGDGTDTIIVDGEGDDSGTYDGTLEFRLKTTTN